MDMLPKPGESLNVWLETALARYALGGVSLGAVVKAWMQSPPATAQYVYKEASGVKHSWSEPLIEIQKDKT